MTIAEAPVQCFMMETFDPAELPELLKLYYRRLFPYSQYYRWLNYGGGDGGVERGVVNTGWVLPWQWEVAPRHQVWVVFGGLQVLGCKQAERG